MAEQSLPPGLTPDMMAAIVAYMTQQQSLASVAPRPSGVLQAGQIRGVNPRYQYLFREYPKALNPPPVTVKSELEERSLRSKHPSMALPWDNAGMIAGYYAARAYPIAIDVPQIVVNSVGEEQARLAEWNMESGDRVAYPRWLFHPSEQPKFVNSLAEEQSLGKGWHATIQEATDEAAISSANAVARERRHKLMEQAQSLGVKIEQNWGEKRIQDAIDAHKKAA